MSLSTQLTVLVLTTKLTKIHRKTNPNTNNKLRLVKTSSSAMAERPCGCGVLCRKVHCAVIGSCYTSGRPCTEHVYVAKSAFFEGGGSLLVNISKGRGLYLYLRGGQLKPPSAEAVYIWPNAQPQYDQRSGKPLSGSREPKKSGWSHFA